MAQIDSPLPGQRRFALRFWQIGQAIGEENSVEGKS
jgi:hypothetical protein